EDTLVLAVGVVQAPVAADRTFAVALPGLVEGLDQVVAPAVGLGQLDEAADEQRLVDPARQGGLALAALAGPAGLADQDVLGRVGAGEGAAHVGDLGQGGVDAGGLV